MLHYINRFGRSMRVKSVWIVERRCTEPPTRTIRTCTYSLLTGKLQILHAIADHKMMVVARLQNPVKEAHHDVVWYLQL